MPALEGKKWYQAHPNRENTKHFVQMTVRVPRVMREDLRALSRSTRKSMESLIREALETLLIDQLGR